MSEPANAILADRRLHRVSSDGGQGRAIRVAARPPVSLSIHDDLASVEDEWRRFERNADCTVFQTFDWVASSYRHIGSRSNTTPAIVLARCATHEPLFLLPLAVTHGLICRLTWLVGELCDYNAPLLAPDFSVQVEAGHFRELWRGIRQMLQHRPLHRHDMVELTKMPENIGAQINPFLYLSVGLNPNGAHLVHLHGSWDQFYQATRSSATRRRDRTKRKRLEEHGEIRFVNPDSADEIACTLKVLIAQKARSFAQMGVENIFLRPGFQDFFLDLATNPRTRHMVHVSRLEVGPVVAATNLGLTFRNRYYHVLASHDGGELSRFGPGAAHLRNLMRRAIEMGFREFDFTIGDERYKFEWADTELRLYDHVAPATLLGWPAAALVRAWARLKRLIKKNPMLWNAVRQLRTMTASISRRKNAIAPN